MITINTDKGLINVESWDDILSRPGFNAELNPNAIKFKSIIGRYIFKAYVKCGLSICHTPHGRGYLVCTEDGQETNIGKDCGKKYFGVDFEQSSKQFDRDVTEANNRSQLESLSFQLEGIESRIRGLLSGENGGYEIQRKCNLLVSDATNIPKDVRIGILEMIRSKSGAIYQFRESTEREWQEAEVMQDREIPRPYYINAQVATLSGVSTLFRENNLKEILVDPIQKEIKAFKELDIDSMTYSELNHWAKWKSTIEPSIEKAEAIIAQGQNLLSLENLEKLSYFIRGDDDKRDLNKFLKKIAITHDNTELTPC